jgi:hypothetical protein
MVLPVINIGSKLDGKGFKQAQTASEKLGNSVKSLAKTFGVTFGAAAMLSYGKNAVKAFAENEKSAKRLETVLKNIGLGFETSGIEKNLDQISAKFGLQGEVLREAFQSLITVTGSATKSQDLLNLSLDVAAGSGQDLLTVNKDLAAVYVGNTRGLKKYDLGLTQSELKTLKFNDAVALLTKNFAGSAAAELETYAGKMRVLREAADNAQESIGTGLVTAFEILAGDGGIEGATDAMTQFGNTSRDVLIGTASYVDKLISKLNKIGGQGKGRDLIGLIPILGGYFGKGGVVEKLAAEGRRVTNAGATPFGDTIKQAQDAAKNAKARAAAEAAAAKRAKELLAFQKKAALVEKNKISLSKAAAEFDTNRISIAAALRATYDKDTRLRLEALMAIEDDDGDKALDRIEQLGILTKAKQAEKLNGLKGITETELAGLNTTLMAELSKIESAKNAKLAAINASGADQAAKDAAKLQAIADADAAEAEAFRKYNDALTKQGGLNDLSFYSKKTQISTLEILELASIETTTAAQLVADEIALAAGLKTVEEIAAARKAAQIADDEAMATAAAAKKAAEDQATSDYFAGLKTKTDAALLSEQDITTATLQGITTVSAAKAEANVLAIDGVGSLAAAQAEANVAALTADADLTTTKLNSIATVAAAQAEANASAIAGVEALSTAIRSIPPYPTWTPPPPGEMPGLPSVAEVPGGLGVYTDLPKSITAEPDLSIGDIFDGLYMDPTLVNPGGGAGSGGNYTITINAGAIASQDEFSALLQETIQDLNRKGDPLFTAGIK